MSAVAIGPNLPWTRDEATERRYRDILLSILLAFLLLSVVLPWLPLFESPEEEKDTELPPRLAELVIQERQPPPEPVEREEPVPQAEPQPEPTPEQTREAARNKAEQAGVMAFAKQLDDLRQNRSSAVSEQRKLSESAEEGTTQRQLVNSDLGEGSSGVRSESGTPGALGEGTQLAGRSTTQVQGPPGGGAVSGGSGRSGSGSHAARTLESIQVVFDRNKSSLFSLYQRALRRSPSLRGTMVLELEIQPSGEVSDVSIVSSEIENSALESKILDRVRLMNFGEKPVPVWRGNYPIRFFPS